MVESWMSEANEGALFVAYFVLLVVTAELGFRIERRMRPASADAASYASTIQAAVLGLLALLLGFTFSLAMARFDARRDMLRDETNAIGTTYLRTRLLPEPMQTRARSLLRTYVDNRFELREVSYDPVKRNAVRVRAAALQGRIWDEAMAAAREDPHSVFVALFVASLNEMIDMDTKHMVAIRNHVPVWIFVLLVLVGVVALGITGYAAGSSHRQAFALSTLVAVLITSVTFLCFDLDRPTRGFITIETNALVDLRDGMRGD